MTDTPKTMKDGSPYIRVAIGEPNGVSQRRVAVFSAHGQIDELSAYDFTDSHGINLLRVQVALRNRYGTTTIIPIMALGEAELEKVLIWHYSRWEDEAAAMTEKVEME